jgi:hypothetical protein
MQNTKAKRRRHAYRMAGRGLMRYLSTIGLMYVEVCESDRRPLPRNEQHLENEALRVLTLLAGERALERGIPTQKLGELTRSRRDAHTILQALNPDPEANDVAFARFDAKAYFTVLRYWTAVEAAAQDLIRNPRIEEERLFITIGRVVWSISTGEALSVAAIAVVHQTLGDTVDAVSLSSDTFEANYGVEFSPANRDRWLLVEAEMNRRARNLKSTQRTQDDLYQQLTEYDYNRINELPLAVQWLRHSTTANRTAVRRVRHSNRW